MHAEKIRNMKDKSIFILAFKTDIPQIMGSMGEGKEISAPLMAIRTPEIWNVHGGVREI